MANMALFPKLEAVRLLLLPCVSEKSLLSLVSGCVSLKLLHISYLDDVRDGEWLEVIGMQRQVEDLEINMCGKLGESELVKLGPRGWRNLRNFEYWEAYQKRQLPRDLARQSAGQVQGCRFPDRLEGAECCRNLKSISLMHSLSTPMTGLPWILAQCKSLEWVEIVGCVGIRDEDIRLVATNNPQVSFIGIRAVGNGPMLKVTHMSLVHISEHLHCLEALVLGCKRVHLPELWESGVEAILERCKQLRSLAFVRINFLGEKAMTTISRSKSVEEVEFYGCVSLTDEMILVIGTNLTRMQLSSCRLLSDKCLDNFRAPHGRLEFLGVNGCNMITKEAASEASEDLDYSPNHEYLYGYDFLSDDDNFSGDDD